MTAPAPTRSEARAHTGARQTEREARDRIAPRAGTLRGNVLRHVAAAGDNGLTALEATHARPEQPACPTCWLVHAGECDR